MDSDTVRLWKPTGAVISPCQKYRYALWRVWDESLGFVNWVMLNPSTADADKDDATIRKVTAFTKAWGYGGLIVTNLFGWRETDSKLLKAIPERRLIGPENNDWLETVARCCSNQIAAWGQGGKLYDRQTQVRGLMKSWGRPLRALRLSKDGTPHHPLYLPGNLVPFDLETR